MRIANTCAADAIREKAYFLSNAISIKLENKLSKESKIKTQASSMRLPKIAGYQGRNYRHSSHMVRGWGWGPLLSLTI